MRKKIIKQILIICFLFMSIFIIYKVIKTYAVFHSEATGTASKELASWLITINGEDVSSGIEESFVVNQINISSNNNVKPGNIAPGLIGNFDITIDTNDTDVSIRYDIQIDASSLTNNQIEITSVEEILENNTLIRTGENTYTGIMSLEDIRAGDTNTIRTSVAWNNDETNNEVDTNIGSNSNPKISIPILVDITQYTGEVITQYTNE